MWGARVEAEGGVGAACGKQGDGWEGEGLGWDCMDSRRLASFPTRSYAAQAQTIASHAIPCINCNPMYQLGCHATPCINCNPMYQLGCHAIPCINWDASISVSASGGASCVRLMGLRIESNRCCRRLRLTFRSTVSSTSVGAATSISITESKSEAET